MVHIKASVTQLRELKVVALIFYTNLEYTGQLTISIYINHENILQTKSCNFIINNQFSVHNWVGHGLCTEDWLVISEQFHI